MTAKKLFFIFSFFYVQFCFAQGEFKSPYIKILNKDSKLDRIPLLMTTVDVDITGLIAQVKVTQIYKNYGDVPLEAQYVFPGSENAALHDVTLLVGSRILKAKIQEKKQAKETYEKAKKEGKTTSLLEQGDAGSFTMRVANILPGDEINVELLYSEKIIPENGIYRFIYPAIGIPSVLNNKKGQSHFTNQKEMGFDMVVNINSALPLSYIESLNHAVDVNYNSQRSANILLDINETLNFKDNFIIEYSFLGNEVNSGILAYEDDDGWGYFLMMMEPPKSFDVSNIGPREYIFVVDSSGSMQGKPLETAQEITKNLLYELKPEDLFNVMLFAGGFELLSEYSMSPSQENIKNATKMVDVSNASGSTNLLGAINRALSIPKEENYSRSLIVLTDGAIDVSYETLEKIRESNHLQNTFAIGVSEWNNDLAAIKAIAKAGNGQEFIVTTDDDLEKAKSDFLDYIRYPLLTNINTQSYGFDELETLPKNLPDLFSRRPLYLTGRFKSSSKGSLEISGKRNNKAYNAVFDLASVPFKKENEVIKYLWAKEKAIDLGDGYLSEYSDNEDTKKQITQLGLDYNLLTSFTSFVAVDDVVRNKDGSFKVGNKNVPEPVPKYSHFGYGAIEGLPIHPEKKLPGLSFIQNKTPLNYTLQDISNRPSITFIIGRDLSSENQYLKSAISIFKNSPEYRTDFVVENMTSLQEVKEYLKTTYSGEPWGVVNIVAHSSPWGGLFANLNNETLNLLLIDREIQSEGFTPLHDNIVDQSTQIRVFGCSLGNHVSLLNMISVYFGGKGLNRPVIQSPVDYVFMSSDDHRIKTFKNDFELINPKLFNLDEFSKSKPSWINQKVKIIIELDSASEYFNNKSAGEIIGKNSQIRNLLKETHSNTNDFEWTKTLGSKGVVITGETVLIQKKIYTNQISSLDLLNFDDPNSVTTVLPSQVF